MKPKFATIVITWTVSLAAAYIIGSKISQPQQEPSDTLEKESTARASYRNKTKATSSNSSTPVNSNFIGSGNTKLGQGITAIMKHSDPIERVNQLLAFIHKLGPNDFAQVLDDFHASGLRRERLSEYSMLLHAWGKQDPLAALDYAEQNTGTRFANQTILASWAAADPNSAIQWAESNYEGNGGNPWLVGVIRGVVNSDTQKASEILATMAYSRERGQALGSIIPHITALGQEEAISWLDTIEDERLRDGATSRIAAQLSSLDPVSTANWVASLENDEVRQRAIGEIAGSWADQDLTSAVAWTETLNGTEKTRAARELIGEYTRENSDQASAWLDSLAGNDGYDRVAQSFIFSTAGSNPELALSKIPTLQNDRSQNRFYERVLTNWHRNDAEASIAWMQANNISESIQQRATRARNR